MSEEKRERNQRREPNGRDQRIFSSSLRSALGGRHPRPSNRRTNEPAREIQPSYQSIEEALKELGRALEQPSTSLDEFEVYIRQNVAKFGEQECQEVASKLVQYALESGEFRFLLRVCSDCIRHLNLMDAVAQELVLAASEYFSNGDVDKQSVPELFGHIISAKWPPGKGKAIENVNPVLFVGLNVVLSWIGIMRSYGEANSSPATTPEEERKEIPTKEDSENDDKKSEGSDVAKNNEVDQKEEEEDSYDEKTAILATLSICTVCNISQRNFWLNYMEEFDNVFVVTKQLLVNPDAKLPRRIKESLLQLYMSLFKWSATNQPKFTSSSTQTN